MKLVTNSVLFAGVSTVAVAQHHYEGGHYYGEDHYYGTAAVPVANTQVTVVAGHHPEWDDHYYPDHYYGTVAVAPAANTPVTQAVAAAPAADTPAQETVVQTPEAAAPEPTPEPLPPSQPQKPLPPSQPQKLPLQLRRLLPPLRQLSRGRLSLFRPSRRLLRGSRQRRQPRVTTRTTRRCRTARLTHSQLRSRPRTRVSDSLLLWVEPSLPLQPCCSEWIS